MSSLIAWAKSNPMSLVAILIVLLSLVLLFAVNLMGKRFVDEMAVREGELNQIKELSLTPVTLPPANVDDPPQKLKVAANMAAIKHLESTYAKLDLEHKQIEKLIVEENRGRHSVMIDGLFPSTDDAALPFLARDRYRESLTNMLKEYSDNALLPRIDAGVPPTIDDIEEELERVESDYIQTAFPLNPGAVREHLTLPQLKNLRKIKQDRLMEILRRRAQQIHIYAQTDIEDPDFPFDVGAWSEAGPRPSLVEIWEGQLGLWIQQDIMQAIAWTNKTDNDKVDVLLAPVKRIVSIEIEPGYVGINSVGAISKLAGTNSVARAPRRQRRSVADGPPGMPFGGFGAAVPDLLSEEERKKGLVPDADKPIPDDFSKGPTGRRSNSIYDVRHAVLTVDIDSKRIGELIDNLAKSNFITVLRMGITDIDEYEMLQDFYLYGSDDVVEARLTLETIWLREWTSPSMPKEVRLLVGIDQPEKTENDQGSPRRRR
jgi:hypothetical protein